MAKQLRMAETEELTRARSPKGELRFHGRDEVQCSEKPPGMSHHEDDDHHGKRSVVARVKDKARKLKNSFRRKKHGGNEDNASPARGTSQSEEEEEEEEEDPEYHGAPSELGAKQACDKDVSVKKYLMEKLQPGEDERALSQVITEAITPGPAGDGDGGGAGQAVVSAVEKFKGAVSSLVGMGDHSGEQIPVSTNPFPRKTFS
ncbi:Low-temperature-induced 65 kDa protein [Platanthera zijinensis]|uniref:Low-temperature-induced 65 kDa protein n=1 Tax=Platanthera zijinensis TaxID=2320716 RepID=A0AAP0FYR5_9ASPA